MTRLHRRVRQDGCTCGNRQEPGHAPGCPVRPMVEPGCALCGLKQSGEYHGVLNHPFTPREDVATGAGMIVQERQRQIDTEGYDAAHDAGKGYALARAGVAYAIAGTGHVVDVDDDVEAWQWWPWSRDAWKPSYDLVRNLVRAGALIAAAIDAHQAASKPLAAHPDLMAAAMVDAEFEARFETASDGGEL